MDPRVVNLLEQLEPEHAAALDREIEGWRDMTQEEFMVAYLQAMNDILDLYNALGELRDDPAH